MYEKGGIKKLGDVKRDKRTKKIIWLLEKEGGGCKDFQIKRAGKNQGV